MKISSIPAFASALLAILAMPSCGLKKEKLSESPAVKVTVLPVSNSKSVDDRTYSGTVTSGDGTEVSFPVPGTVKAIHVDEGQRVTKGQLLAELNTETLENTYNIAKAALDGARDSYARFKQLHEAGALADIKWVEVQNALKAAENSAAIAKRALGDAKIHAPVNGIVSKKHIDVGQTVVPALPAISIVALSDVKISIPVPENEIGTMIPGSTADIVVDALDGLHLTGTLSEKGVVANPLTRAFDVKYSVSNHDGKLLPGMVCTVKPVNASTDSTTNIILPPQAVLLSADNRNFVWLAKRGRAKLQFVEPAGLAADGVIISHGLTPGDSVIVAGMQKVSEGTEIIPEI